MGVPRGCVLIADKHERWARLLPDYEDAVEDNEPTVDLPPGQVGVDILNICSGDTLVDVPVPPSHRPAGMACPPPDRGVGKKIAPVRACAMVALLLVPWGVGLLAASPPPGKEQKTLVREYDAAYSPEQQLLKEILDEMRGLRSDLKGALANGQIKTDARAVINARCASCHKDGVVDQKGSVITLVEKDGSIPPFSTLEKKVILSEIESNRMPKTGGPLTAAERKAIRDFLVGEPDAARGPR